MPKEKIGKTWDLVKITGYNGIQRAPKNMNEKMKKVTKSKKAVEGFSRVSFATCASVCTSAKDEHSKCVLSTKWASCKRHKQSI